MSDTPLQASITLVREVVKAKRGSYYDGSHFVPIGGMEKGSGVWLESDESLAIVKLGAPVEEPAGCQGRIFLLKKPNSIVHQYNPEITSANAFVESLIKVSSSQNIAIWEFGHCLWHYIVGATNALCFSDNDIKIVSDETSPFYIRRDLALPRWEGADRDRNVFVIFGKSPTG